MCDQDAFDDMIENTRRSGELTRRRFGVLAFASGLAAALPRVAGAVEVVETDIDVKTPDGVADSYFVYPATGAHPGVLIWTDIFGLRPAFKMMGKRLAESGYSVLVPNPFYRSGKAPIPPLGSNMQDAARRQMMMSLMDTLTPPRQVTDAKAFVEFLDAQPSVNKKRKLGTVGYCMGGPITMRAAAALPDRIGAGASFHGANLANDKPDSPHLLVPKMKARFLIAIAANDDERDPKAKDLLREAFMQAKLPAEIEVYEGTMHGWCPPDTPVYNEAQAEKAWSRMLALFKSALV
jgi:carboxymethylenebutenolidase